MRGLVKAVGTALALLAIAASPAAADDASLLAAYNGHQPELDQAMNEYTAIVDQVKNHQATDDQFRGLISANAHIDQVLRVIAGEIRAQAPSTKHGARAKKHALREIALWILANNWEDRAFNAAITDHDDQYDRLYRRADRAANRAVREARRVHAEFKAVGLKAPRNGVGA